MSVSFLLEIGTEEIPAGYIQPALEAMAGMLHNSLQSQRVPHGEIKSMGTPRRLVWVIREVAEEQESQTVELTGPPKQAAFDADGNPTKAAIGFARAQGVAVEDLQVKQTPKGEYVVLRCHQPGQPTARVLAALLPDLIQAIPFPKSMRWHNLKVHFARPVHWIVALLGTEVVPVTFGNVNSGNTSYGHRFMSPEPFVVSDIDAYVEELRQRYVIVDIDERRQMIRQEVAARAAELGGQLLEDEDLLDEVTNLVEYPTAVYGHFDRRYLELPREVLITAMRAHQRYFAVVGDDGSLLPGFVTVNNTRTRDPQVVARGNERVLRARLEDARYYYELDQRVPLEQRAEELKQVVFHSKLGTSWEKMERFKALAEYMAAQVAPEHLQVVSRAAYLCKADLVTGTVGEFPELQGVMGRAYARIAGEPEEVAAAIYEHYLPTHAGGELPRTLAGSLISIADKLDTLVGCFGIGQIPTGTADPYALRRQTIGIIRILLDKKLKLRLADLIERAIEGLSDKLTEPAEQIHRGVLDFVKVRLQNLLVGQGYEPELVEAVLALHLDPLIEARARIDALKQLQAKAEFEPLVATAKRVLNILKEEVDAAVDAERFTTEAEKVLQRELQECQEQVRASLAAADYVNGLEQLLRLRAPIDRFFEDVLVLDPDPEVRRNRLALLTGIANLFRQFADFSRLG